MFPLRRDSVKAADFFGAGTFDLVFIDTSHEEEQTKREILAWSPKLKPGGLLCGHDFDHPTYKGVRHAVEALLPNFQLYHSIWFQRKV